MISFLLIAVAVFVAIMALGCVGVLLLDRYIQRTGKNKNEKALMYFFLGMPLLPFVFLMAIVRGAWVALISWAKGK